MNNALIYGKNTATRIVSIEPGESTIEVFRQLHSGDITSDTIPLKHWILYADQLSDKMRRLEGDQTYKWLIEYDSKAKYLEVLEATRMRRYTHYVCRDDKEAFMVKNGVTMFKGLKVADVSVLSFDIETTGIAHNKDSKVLLISNTFRAADGKITKRLFALDDVENNQKGLFLEWSEWVREMNPSIVIGHNIYGFDLPYIQYVAKREGVELELGRNGSAITFDKRTSKFRKDGSQSYDYNNARIYGREIVDTFFLAIKYDVGRKYESYGLKGIIKQEGLEKKGRQHYDAGSIKDNWHDPVERTKIKAYAIDDADDALALYDLMIAPFFYATQSIPRSLQHVINSASGSQINSIMVRGYLQAGHSIAEGSNKADYEGAISLGIPGLHKNVLRFDAVSLYPSIMRQYRIHCPTKDTKKLFLEMVNFFTEERLANKAQAKATGERYFKDLEQSQKIMINSMYGFLGAPKLNYNYPAGAAEVTRRGREILKKAIMWATGKEFTYDLEEIETSEDVA